MEALGLLDSGGATEVVETGNTKQLVKEKVGMIEAQTVLLAT